MTEEKVLESLKQIKDPDINKSLIELDAVRELKIKGENVSLKILLARTGTSEQMEVQKEIVSAVKGIGADSVGLRFEARTTQKETQQTEQAKGDGQKQQGVPPLLAPDTKTTFIAVTSGKGGVGKSTVTVNLATALARMGKKVGIIDADIYGFSVPDMIGVEERPKVVDNIIHPVERHGVKVMSMGFFVEDNSPVIWRGPMLGKMLRNFFGEVEWGDIDYMILDLPPGTGDVALDVHQMLPQSKEIIVTTPHATAAFVAARAGSMAIKTNHEIIGVVENMAYYQLPDGNKDYIFGQGGGDKLADVLQTEVIAQIPLGQPEHDDDGPATAIYSSESTIGQTYAELAKKVLQDT